MNYPTQNYQQPPQQGYPVQPPAPMSGAAAHLHAQAEAQVWRDVASQPKRNHVSRERMPDGTHHIMFTKAEVISSKKDGRLMLMLHWNVIDSTVPEIVGKEYSFPQFFSNRYQMQDLSDIAKDIWGEQEVSGWANNGLTCSDVAVYIAQWLSQNVAAQGMFANLVTRRSNKDGETYDTAFVNHTFRNISQDRNHLPALPQRAPAPQMGASQGMPMPPAPQQSFAPPTPQHQQPPQQAFAPSTPQQSFAPPTPQPQQPSQQGFAPPAPPQGFPQPQQGFAPPAPPQGFPQPQQAFAPPAPPQGFPQPQQPPQQAFAPPAPPQGFPQPQQPPAPPFA